MNTKKKISVVVTIPAFNEAMTIQEVIRKVPDNIIGISEIKILVIDDGSTDETARLAAEAGAQVVSFGYNKGLGAAFRQAFQSALQRGADIIVNIDGDGQFNPQDISKLVQPILEGKADMVTASRFADPSMVPQMPWIKKWGNHRVAQLVNKLSDQHLKDVSCGFRAYTRDAALRATLMGGHTYTHEVILELAFRGLKIMEVPINVIGVRKYGESKVAGNLWKYGWNSLVIMLRAFRDYRPMHVFGGISLFFLILTIMGTTFVTAHYILTGSFSPYIFIAFTTSGCGFVALITFITAMMAGMLTRLRILQDEQLFLLRKREYENHINE